MFPHGDWNLSAADKNYSVCPECEDFFFFFASLTYACSFAAITP